MPTSGGEGIVPPLVVGERWDLRFFRSPDDVPLYFEPWFALEDYVAFDSTGRDLVLDAGDYRERPVLFGLFHLSSGGEMSLGPSPTTPDPAGARDVLIQYLTNPERRSDLRFDRADLKSLSLLDLIEKAARIEGWTPK